jgi:NADPH:quinone reductase-like Zn-dependent oxidoreductase
LNKLSNIKSGTSILINGATGGIGMFLTQLAKKKGAIVTAVASTKGIEIAQGWGADEIIDYKKQNVLSLSKTFDVVVDLSGRLGFKDAKGLLKPQGIFIATIPGLKTIIGSFINNIFSAKKYKVLILKPASGDLELLADSIEDKLDITVEKTYPMTSVKEAYTEVAKGGLLGKAVIVL